MQAKATFCMMLILCISVPSFYYIWCGVWSGLKTEMIEIEILNLEKF